MWLMHARAHKHTHAHAHECMHMHKYTDICMHARMHTHTYNTHDTYTHTRIQFGWVSGEVSGDVKVLQGIRGREKVE